jgi:probable addiction module antidote protein
MPLETIPWDAAEFLETKEDIDAYLNAAFEDGDPDVINLALSNVARAKGLPGKAQSELRSSLSSQNIGSVFSVLKTIGLPPFAAA